MSKQVSIDIIIDEDGNLVAEPNGTEGPECLDLMSFLDKIEGFTVIETVKKNNCKTKKVQINSIQKIKQ